MLLPCLDTLETITKQFAGGCKQRAKCSFCEKQTKKKKIWEQVWYLRAWASHGAAEVGARWEGCDWRRRSSYHQRGVNHLSSLLEEWLSTMRRRHRVENPLRSSPTWEWENFILYLTSPRCWSATAVSHPAAGSISLAGDWECAGNQTGLVPAGTAEAL